MQEIWKDIKGYEGLYQVSNLGNVKSVRRNLILKANYNKGYLQLDIYYKGTKTNRQVHRLVAETFIPNPDNKPQVNHINGIKDDNRVGNLEWVTCQENIQHAFDTDLKSSQGTCNNFSKLTDSEVLQIYDLAHCGLFKQREIGEFYNVHKDTVSAIKTKKNWKHLFKNQLNNII